MKGSCLYDLNSNQWICQPPQWYLLIVLALLIVIAYIVVVQRRKFMASVSDLTAAINTLNATIATAVADLGGAIKPSDLDPVLASINQANQTLSAALAPPQP